jgi:2'-5' RNA ligase
VTEPRLEGKTYALWLIPSGEVRQQLARTIRELSHQHSTPDFAPHITLVSSIVGSGREVTARTAQLTKSLRPLRVRLTGLAWRDEYFRCLFVKVARTSPLVRAHHKAREAFGVRGRGTFLPHVSLVYGDLPLATKRKIVLSLGRRFDLQFEVRRIDIVAIEGPPSHWRRLRSFSLGLS